MNISDKIRLADLLLQRDTAFVRVAECERQIQGLLGAPYPFLPLPDLPSLRRKKAAKKTLADKASVPRDALKLRALRRPLENAYRVEYRRHELATSSFLTDGELLRRLLLLDTAEFKITAIAAVSLRAPTDFTVSEELWRE